MRPLEKECICDYFKTSSTVVLFGGQGLEREGSVSNGSHGLVLARPVPKRQRMQKGRRLPEGGVPFKPGAREPELTLGGGGGELSPFLAPGCVVTPSGARRGEWD